MFSDLKRKQTTPFREAGSLIHTNEVVVRVRGGDESLHPRINTQYIRAYHSGVCGEGEELIHSQACSECLQSTGRTTVSKRDRVSAPMELTV